MFTRRNFLQGITYTLSSIAVSKFGWLGFTSDANPIEPPVPDKLPEVTKLLIGVRTRISSPENWCQRFYMDGAKRCLIGALIEELNLREDRQMPLEEGVLFQPDFNENDEIACHYIRLARIELFPDFVWKCQRRSKNPPLAGVKVHHHGGVIPVHLI
jgi:hypothetical protein